MRGDYGKLIYMLQDTMLASVQELLQCPCVDPIVTVYKFLADRKVSIRDLSYPIKVVLGLFSKE